jgi:uncharacterized delta-60 repeat protein
MTDSPTTRGGTRARLLRWWPLLLLLPIALGAALLLATRPGPAALDPAFGDGGLVLAPPDASSTARAVALQPDGRIVVAGNSGGDLLLARFLDDGAPDATFGSGGYATTDLGGEGDVGSAVILQPDGRIVVAGTAGDHPSGRFVLLRYEPDGAPDTSFGQQGRVIDHFGYDAFRLSVDHQEARAVALQPDGKIVVVGDNGEDVILARYDGDGAPDAAFGSGGHVMTDLSTADEHSHESGQAAALLPDGRIVVATVRSKGFGLLRYDGDGALDTSFGEGGEAAIRFGDYSVDLARALAVQPDGRIVVAGVNDEGHSGNVSHFALVRFTGDGRPDVSFGRRGKVTTHFGRERESARAVALQADGRIVAVGTSSDRHGCDLVVARYTSSGRLEAASGEAPPGLGGRCVVAQAVALQPDGKVVVAGYTCDGDQCAVALVRYSADE